MDKVNQHMPLGEYSCHPKNCLGNSVLNMFYEKKRKKGTQQINEKTLQTSVGKNGQKL